MWVYGLDGLVNTNKLEDIQIHKTPPYVNVPGDYIVLGYGQMKQSGIRVLTHLFSGSQDECQVFLSRLAKQLEAKEYLPDVGFLAAV